MKFRHALEEDVDECVRLASGEDYWSSEDFLYSVKNENAIFLVAEDKERIVGYVTGFILPSKEDEAMVHETRVDPEQRGRGVGTKLVNKFCEQASERGVELIYAYIESELKSFYIKSCDFKETENNWIEVSKKT